MLTGSCPIMPGYDGYDTGNASSQTMIYEFKCSAHGTFAAKQAMNEVHEAACPICRAPAQRVYSALGHTYDNPKSLWFKNGTREQL